MDSDEDIKELLITNDTASRSDDQKENSPIEQVALTVPVTDDPSLPVFTFRTWTLGTLACFFLSFLNQFFGFRREPLSVTAISAQIAVVPLGHLMAATVTDRVFMKGSKWEFTLNPGKFNVKEHVLITIFASSGAASVYAIHFVSAIKVFYRKEITVLVALLVVLTTQVLGFGWAGVFRRYLVEPAAMWWPQNLVQVSLFRALHETEERKKGGLTRNQFFLITFICSFAYYVFPGYLFPILTSLSWVTEMEAILSEHNNAMPARDVLQALADKFSESPDRKGKITVQNKQVWNWFQNKRYAIRAKTSKTPAKLNITPMPRVDFAPGRIMSQPTASPIPAPSASVQGTAKLAPENSVMEFEAKSGRDGAWYDVANFLSYRHLESSDPEVLVRFSGFGSDEDEWINVRKNVRPRSLPCESSECVAVLAGDLILCFQEGKEQALYYDAHVLDAQRRRHDVRGCRCRFLVRYDHDQSEEIVTLRKVCRRPETDYRLHQLHAVSDAPPADHQKISLDHPANVQSMRVTHSSEMVQKQQQIHIVTPVLQTNVSVPPQSMNVDPVKIETKPDIQAGNPVTLGTATFTPSIITTSSVPEVSTQNLAEEK